MAQTFFEYFRCPDSIVKFDLTGGVANGAGFFRFGRDVTCYGRSTISNPPQRCGPDLQDLAPFAAVYNGAIALPFEVDEIAKNLRYEFYAGHAGEEKTHLPPNPVVRNLYYFLRPLMPVHFRRILQRIVLRQKMHSPFPHWPVDRTVDLLFESLMGLAIRARSDEPIPFIWFWPDGAGAALILTHDVETEIGRDTCSTLMDLDDEFGFKGCFQIIPEKRYEVTQTFLEEMRTRGFEINVHDLNHDGNLFRNRGEFLRRVEKINRYAQEFRTSGFRSGALYRNVHWYNAFRFSYDMSVPNVAHLDPQGGGCCTIMPYFVGELLEIPVTAIQDYSLFNILNTYSIDLWKEQTQLIMGGHGLISIIVHPDYIIDRRARATYRALLAYLAQLRKRTPIWATLPLEIDRWWRLRREMKLVRQGDNWRIDGAGSERARIAYAQLKEGRLTYSFDSSGTTHLGGPSAV